MDSTSAVSSSYKSINQYFPRPQLAKETDEKPRKYNEYFNPLLALELGAVINLPSVTKPIRAAVSGQYLHLELMDDEQAEAYKPGNKSVAFQPMFGYFFESRLIVGSMLGFGLKFVDLSGGPQRDTIWGKRDSEFFGSLRLKGKTNNVALEIIMRSPPLPLSRNLALQLEYNVFKHPDMDLYYSSSESGSCLNEWGNRDVCAWPVDEFRLGAFDIPPSHRIGVMLKHFLPQSLEWSYMTYSLFTQLTPLKFHHAEDRRDMPVTYATPVVQFGLEAVGGFPIF